MSDMRFGETANDEYPLLEQPPGQPTYGENHAFWIFDAEGRYYINTHLNSVESFWPLRRETVGICLPDDGILVGMNEGAQTRADAVGGANLVMRCDEPFRRWTVSFAGTLLKTAQSRLAAGAVTEYDGERIVVRFEADVRVQGPVIHQGGIGKSSHELGDTVASRYIGGTRYEQLFRAEARLQVGAGSEIRFSGTGTRTHRRGTRNVGGYAGHDWQSALFPDGSGFYFMRFPTAEGGIAYSEACVIRHGRLYPAEVLSDTWMTSRQVAGEKMLIRLGSELGETAVEGETLGTVLRAMNATPGNPLARVFGFHNRNEGAIGLSQAWARYSLGGQTATGLCERSTFSARL